MRGWRGFGAFFLLSFFSAQTAGAQQACPTPPVSQPKPGSNIFTPRQEMDLGDAVAEQIQRELLVIDDEDYTAYLQRVGDRLLKHLPPTDLKIHFFLFDLPIANAFSTPGGRIYVSRKLVAFLHSEDELASVLGHELGHEITRQLGMEMTERFRKVLDVTQVGDRQDIFQKYNLLVENARRKGNAFNRSSGAEEKGQLVADQVGVYAVANAGYNAQSFADFWDRLAQTKGKKGGFLSDLFGMTSPESKRLREMIKGAATIPAGCIETRPVTALGEFQKWQAAVVAYSGLGHKEQLHSVLSKKTLDPPLRADIEQLRFSPDGNYLLAQDESGVYVLTRQPLLVKFHFDARDARPAYFTPDSQEVVFYTPGLRVERWNVEQEQRTAVNELVIRGGCLQTQLSRDGTVLGCFGREWSLSLYDVASGTQLFEKKEFYEPTLFEYLLIVISRILDETPPDILNMKFSPDGRYFAVSSRTETTLVYDFQQKKPIGVPGSIRKLLVGAFDFLGPDRLVGVDTGKAGNSAIVRFPGGEVLDRLTLGGRSLTTAADPRYLLLRPIQDYPVGAMDLETKKIVGANKVAAYDVYHGTIVSERRTGELGLYPVGESKPTEVVLLPIGSLGKLRASGVSADLNYLVVSERTRGGVWNLQTNARMYLMRGFNGIYFAEDGGVYADFPKLEKTERQIVRMNLGARGVIPALDIGDDEARQYGGVLVRTKHPEKKSHSSSNVQMQGVDVRTGITLWSKDFPKEEPGIWGDAMSPRLVFHWQGNSGGAKNEIKNTGTLTQKLGNVKFEEDDVLLEVIDAVTGKSLGGVAVNTGKGSFRAEEAMSAADWVVVSDNINRILVYSLTTGEEKGRLFGNHPAISSVSGLLCAGNERGQLTIYDLATLSKRDEFLFSSPVAFASFAADGKRLLILTENQNTYVLDVSQAARGQASTTTAKPL